MFTTRLHYLSSHDVLDPGYNSASVLALCVLALLIDRVCCHYAVSGPLVCTGTTGDASKNSRAKSNFFPTITLKSFCWQWNYKIHEKSSFTIAFSIFTLNKFTWSSIFWFSRLREIWCNSFLILSGEKCRLQLLQSWKSEDTQLSKIVLCQNRERSYLGRFLMNIMFHCQKPIWKILSGKSCCLLGKF